MQKIIQYLSQTKPKTLKHNLENENMATILIGANKENISNKQYEKI